MRQAPESVQVGLRSIKDTMRIQWNPTAVMKGAKINAFGQVVDRIFEPRWEVWDVDAQGKDYMITRVQTDAGEFMEPDQRLVDMLNLCNPARWGGDIRRMVRALVDEPNERLKESEEREFQEFAGQVGRDVAQFAQPKVTVPASIT